VTHPQKLWVFFLQRKKKKKKNKKNKRKKKKRKKNKKNIRVPEWQRVVFISSSTRDSKKGFVHRIEDVVDQRVHEKLSEVPASGQGSYNLLLMRKEPLLELAVWGKP